MATASAADSDVSPMQVGTRPPRRPFYADPLRLLGWGIALLAVLAYWQFFVRPPVAKPGQPVARLTAIEGRVRVKPNADERWNEARLSERLRVGDVLQTESRSGAVISFDGDPRQPGSGSVVQVRPDSVVYIGGSAETSTAAWRVQSGTVDFAVGEAVTEIATPGVLTTAMKNAAGNIDVTDEGSTGVKIFRGQAELQTALGQKITLEENQAVRVDAAGQAGARLDLPPPPTPLAPASKAQVVFVPPPATVTTLVWTAGGDGVSYRVAIDYNVTQADILLAAALDEDGIPTAEHELKGLSPGRYFWRVAAVNRDGLEGAFSRVSSFSVLSAPAPRPAPTAVPARGAPRLVVLAAEEVSPGVVHVGGRADPGSQVTIDGASVPVMPDGSFSEYVRRATRAAVVVRATAADGRFAVQTRPLARGHE